MANPDLDSQFFVKLPWYLRSAKHLENCCTDLDISLGGVDPSWKDQPVEVDGMSWCYIYIYLHGKQIPNVKQHEHASYTSRNQNHRESPIKSNNCRKSFWFFDAYSTLSIWSWLQNCGFCYQGFSFWSLKQTMMLSESAIEILLVLNLLSQLHLTPKGLCIWLAEPRPGLCFSLLLQLGATEKKDQL